MKKKIGFIGLGVMGSSMARHLLNSGLELYLYSRTKSKADELIKDGAVFVSSAKELASIVDVLFTIVGFVNDVEDVYLGEKGIVSGAHNSLVCCDMTTTKPSLMLEINKALTEKGAFFADAPVSGGDIGAKNATLTFMVGASKDTFNKLLPYFSIMGKTINLQGPVSMGQQTKMCNQITIAGTMIGVSESLIYAAKAGLDVEKMLSTISKGAAGCWTIDNLAPRVVNHNFEPGFMISHFVKDMSIALEEAANMNLSLPGLSLVKQLYQGLLNQDMGKLGTQALVSEKFY